MSYLMLHVIKVMSTVWACETGKIQAIKINTTVHDVLNSTSNGKIKKELYLFSLQIMYRDNTFSAENFTVDATLLTAASNQLIFTLYKLI
ncbi:PREDICTED: putative gustatory receptor 28b [Wasmannia auropunctata]|uniref:putative gustatory receptor 28b n=1 Tax=Wasmannia auropunctata TaxID=64793 RepID=UPI0005EDF42B|nr:PREDICTED: putative gustatory receptor 28b [Wasmannia auropunctata]